MSTPNPDVVRNWYETPSIAFDLDGTICLDRFPDFGPVIPETVALMARAKASGYWVVVGTSRSHGYFPRIEHFLKSNGVTYDQLATGAKANADIYVDDRGLLPPAHALDALIGWHKRGSDFGSIAKSDSDWVREQRNVPESPDFTPSYFGKTKERSGIMVPLTGGLDSSTAYRLAHENNPDANIYPFYVQFGPDDGLRKLELEAIGNMLGIEPIQLDVEATIEQDAHIKYGRNAAILFSIGKFMKDLGIWGEIWFGNLGGETPIVGGDKSSRFLATTQHLLTISGIDARIVSPFQALDKTDLIRMWIDWGDAEHLRSMKTCFSTTEHRCRACQTCFRMFAAMLAFDETFQLAGAMFYPFEGLIPFAKKYESARTGAANTYGSRRMRGMEKALKFFREEWSW